MDMAPSRNSGNERQRPARALLPFEPLVSADFSDSNELLSAEAELLDRLIGAEVAKLFEVAK